LANTIETEMKTDHKLTATLLVGSHCPHCHALESLLRQRLESGALETLDVFNVENSPELTQQYNVRSVPWLQLDGLIFNQALSPSELDDWISNIRAGTTQRRYIAHLLEHGDLPAAIEWIEQGKASLKVVVDLLSETDSKLNVRIGIGAILEHFEDSDAIRSISNDLISLLNSDDVTIRTDACHYLSLTHSNTAIGALEKMLEDKHPQVREVARESLEVLLGDN
jgi:glutaredoxin